MLNFQKNNEQIVKSDSQAPRIILGIAALLVLIVMWRVASPAKPPTVAPAGMKNVDPNQFTCYAYPTPMDLLKQMPEGSVWTRGKPSEAQDGKCFQTLFVNGETMLWREIPCAE